MDKNRYDILVIGGGIIGACIFWEACLRGLSAALVEQSDYASGASANSLKTIHGGLRYLQQADFVRMRMSTNERTTLMRIAPHLVHPLPVIVPTYGHGTHGKEALGLAMRMNDLINFDRNRSVHREKRIPRGRVLSKRACLQRIPDLPTQNLSGAAQFYDAQVYNSERLVLAFLKSGAQVGGDLANYAKVTDFSIEHSRLRAVKVCDVLSGQCYEVQARMVINCAGAWTPILRRLLPSGKTSRMPAFAKAINIVTRPLFKDFAVGLNSGEASSRLLFVAPWRDKSIIGTNYMPYNDSPDRLRASGADIDTLLHQINGAYPAADLRREDVTFVHRGLLPLKETPGEDSTIRLSKHPHIIDHRQDGIEGLLSVVGVKYTTARRVAEDVLDRILKLWDRRSTASTSAKTPLRGGEMQSIDDYLSHELTANTWGLSQSVLTNLIYNYGTEYGSVLSSLPADDWHDNPQGERNAVLAAQIYHAVYKEMAVKLADFVFRRTGLASASQPDSDVLAFCARTMGKVLNWEDARIQQEIEDVNTQFSWKQ